MSCLVRIRYEITALTLPLLPLLTGHVNDVLLGQSRACPGRAIVTVGTGDGVVMENACMLYQVPVAHKIDVPRDRNCIVSTCDGAFTALLSYALQRPQNCTHFTYSLRGPNPTIPRLIPL